MLWLVFRLRVLLPSLLELNLDLLDGGEKVRLKVMV